MTHRKEAAPNPVQQFLQSLDAPVDDSVSSLLLKEGFRTKSDLRGLALLPTRAAVLYKFVETQELTYWQFILLRDGLERLAAKSSSG